AARPSSRSARLPSARGVVFRPDSAPAKPPKTGHQRGFSGKSGGIGGRLAQSSTLALRSSCSRTNYVYRPLTSYRLGMALSSDVDSRSRQEKHSNKKRVFRSLH